MGRARVLVVLLAVILAALAIGAEAASAATVQQLAAAWGDNAFGQLGNGDNTFSNRNVPVRVINLGGVTGVAAGGYHSLANQQCSARPARKGRPPGSLLSL